MTPPDSLADFARITIEAMLRAADPGAALSRAWVDPPPGPVFLAAIGKASVGMASVAASRLGDRLVDGVVIAVPERLADARLPATIRVLPADHPLPSARNVDASRALLSSLRRFADENPEGTVVALISGGGSAHLTLPAEGLSLDDLRTVSRSLQRTGAPIRDLNAVRKHTEQLKGGRLAAAVLPARVEAFIVSDVIGDPLDVIASGPLSPDPTTFADAIAVLDRWSCRGVSAAVDVFLERGARGERAETPKPGDAVFSRVRGTIITNNRAGAEAVRAALGAAGVTVICVEHGVEGDAADTGRRLARTLALYSGTRPACLVFGGETTVRVGASRGRGGPSQELALACAIEFERSGLGERAGVVTFSSDGIDGPTDAAGAAVLASDIGRARAASLDPEGSLAAHDSHTLLDRLSVLVRTGPTGTNVNHVAVGVLLKWAGSASGA